MATTPVKLNPQSFCVGTVTTARGRKGDHEHGRKSAPNEYSAESFLHILRHDCFESLTSPQRSEIVVRCGTAEEYDDVRASLLKGIRLNLGGI